MSTINELAEALKQTRQQQDGLRAAGAQVRPCPACRGYDLERLWCSRCEGRGVVEASRHG